jgi:protease-4
MKKFLIGLVLGIVITVFAGVVFALAMARLADQEPTVPKSGVLRVALSGHRKAAVDDRIKTVVVEPRMPSLGWATAQEIRQSLEKFKSESGKPVYAYLRTPRMVDYYIASAADKIYCSPEDLLLIQGMRLEVMYLRNTLDKVGITVEVEHAGKYKDAGDMFTERGMTPETREVLTSILDRFYGDFLDTTGKARGKSSEEIAAIVDRGPFTAAAAVDEGLLDGVRHAQALKDEIKEAIGLDEYKEVEARKYRAVSPSSLGLTGKSSVAFVVAQGSIIRGRSDAFTQSSLIASESIAETLREVGKKDDIKGVVVRIDSPGGDAVASDEILEAMRELSRKKPVVISMSDAAASGGYYMAMTGDPIIAYPSTLTGSIGVVFTKPVLRGLYDKLGITKEALNRGKNSAFLSDYVPLDPPARAQLKSLIDSMYSAFLAEVATGRNRPLEEIAPLAEGRVWLGSQAIENGLVDEIGGIDAALAALKKKAGIDESDKLKVYVYPGRKSFFEMLASLESGSAGIGASRMLQGTPFETLLKDAYIQSLREPGVQALMPYSLTVE